MEQVKVSNGETVKNGVVSPISDADTGPADCKPVSNDGRITGPTRRSSKGGWTEEEDNILAAAVRQFSGRNWKKIASCLPERTDVQCLHRWQKVLNPDLVKGPWTKDEDDTIVELVGKFGNKQWSEMAKYLPGRIGKQCRERWYNHLNPDINKNPWTKEEELALIQAHKIYGNKWAEIAKVLHGRTENSIKNHWNCSLKKKLCQFSTCEAALSHPGPSVTRSHSHERDAGNRKFEVAKHELGRTLSPHQKMESRRSVQSCFPKLILKNSKGRKNPLQSPALANHGISREGSNELIKPTSESRKLTGERFQDGSHNVKTSRDPRHIAELSSIFSSYDDNPSPLRKHTNSTCDLVNPSCPLHPLGYLPSSSTAPLNVTNCNANKRVSPSETVLPVSAKSLELSRGAQGNISPINGLDGGRSSFSGQSNGSHPIRPIYGANEKRNGRKTPSSSADINFGGLCYEPLQKEDLKFFRDNGEFPSTDSYIRLPPSPVSFHTPTSHEKAVFLNYSSPEYILRTAAMSFKTMPSIIGKRRFQTSRQVGNVSPSPCTTEEKNAATLGHVKDDLSSGVFSNAKQLFSSPPKSRKLESSDTVKSVERRLEVAFDSVEDSDNFDLDVSAEA